MRWYWVYNEPTGSPAITRTAGFLSFRYLPAPLTVPPMLALSGAPGLFVLFAVFFAIAAIAAWGLVDRRGRGLDDR